MHTPSLLTGAFLAIAVCLIVLYELLKSCKRIMARSAEENRRLREEIACYRWRDSQASQMLDRVGVRGVERN